MGSKQETTTTTSIAGIGRQEQQARDLMSQLANSGIGQMGDLSALASGQLQISPQDELLIRQINELTAESARKNAMQNFEELSGAVESRALDRGIEGSSIEAVNQALMGRQLQSTLDQSALQQQISSAQQLQQQTLQRAGLQLNTNQLLLNQILGGAGAVSQMGLQERLAQQTTHGVQEQSGLGHAIGQVANIGGQVLGAMTPMGAAATAAPAVATALPGSTAADYQALGGNNPYVQL